ncbi:MAG: DUF3224 domain-containing protein [Mycoplasmatales bacterium]
MNKSILEVTGWDEPKIENFSNENDLSVAHVTYIVKGWLEGTIKACYVIHYTNYDENNPHAAVSTFTGYSKFKGEINGKAGTIVFLEAGEYASGLFSKLTIKPETATGAFVNLEGKASYSIMEKMVVLETEF